MRMQMKFQFQAQTVNKADAEASRLRKNVEFSKEVARLWEEQDSAESGVETTAIPCDIDYSNMTVVQLKDELRAKGLKVSGRKSELVERLESYP